MPNVRGRNSRQMLTADVDTGRPYNQDAANLVIAALRNGNSRPASAAAGSLSMGTFLRWLSQYRDFKQAVFEAESFAERAHVSNINKAAKDGKWLASAWWLERTKPMQYGKIDRVEVMHRQQQADNLADELAAEGIEITATDLLREAEVLRKNGLRAAGALPPGPPRKGQRMEISMQEAEFTEIEDAD